MKQVNLDGIAVYDVLSSFEPVDLLCPIAGSKSDAQQVSVMDLRTICTSFPSQSSHSALHPFITNCESTVQI